MVPDHADPARRLIVHEVTLRDFRSYELLELGLEPGLVLVTGENGTGKTNLLEALHVGTQGFSPRTRMDAHLVRMGAERARVSLAGERTAVKTEVEVTLGAGEPKRARLDGAVLRSAEQLRSKIATLVFTPDRLAVVKGGPAVRRAYVDRALARLLPSRSAIPLEYASALGQRNAVLRRAAAGQSTRDAIAPWTVQVARLGEALVDARRETLELLCQGFAERAAELGLVDASLAYEAEAPTVDQLAARLDRDLERGTTSVGPHLDEIAVRAGRRDLRVLGSQGEQRIAVLALLLAEAEVLSARRGSEPLVLLDDVLSELDGERRRALGARVSVLGQAIVTSTSRVALPLEPAQHVEVRPGVACAVS